MSKLTAMLKLKCPRCGVGDLYLSHNPYNFKDLGKMPSHCPHCGQEYSPEPGFYFGATYVSYALTVAYFVTGFLANWLLFHLEFNTIVTTLIVIFVLLSPMVFRLSRSLWLGMFVKHRKDLGE